MNYTFKYSAEIRCNETDEVVSNISSSDPIDLEEEMGKTKWSGAVKKFLYEKECEQIDSDRTNKDYGDEPNDQEFPEPVYEPRGQQEPR